MKREVMKATDLETMISLRQFRNTSSLEKRFLYSQGITNYSTYRSTSHFSSNRDDPSTLPPVIFPLSLTTDTLASLPMLVLNDSYTMVQPTVKLARLGGGEYCVECVIRLTGAVAGAGPYTGWDHQVPGDAGEPSPRDFSKESGL